MVVFFSEGNILLGIQRCSVVPKLKMQVGPGGEFAGISDDSDWFPDFNPVTHMFQQFRIMLV